MELNEEFKQAIRNLWGDIYTVGDLAFNEAVSQGLIGESSRNRTDAAIRIGVAAGVTKELSAEDFFHELRMIF